MHRGTDSVWRGLLPFASDAELDELIQMRSQSVTDALPARHAKRVEEIVAALCERRRAGLRVGDLLHNAASPENGIRSLTNACSS
jgi:hypothetical protein